MSIIIGILLIIAGIYFIVDGYYTNSNERLYHKIKSFGTGLTFIFLGILVIVKNFFG